MIGLAIVFVLMVVMFLFFRQKMAYYEVRLELLSDTVQTMAGITRTSLHESESDHESESESDPESEEEYVPRIINLGDLPKFEIGPVYESVELIPAEVIPDIGQELPTEIVEPVEELIVVSDDETKKIELPTEFDSLSVKELKEKVAELNGPKLKTKKDLIQFLQNKI